MNPASLPRRLAAFVIDFALLQFLVFHLGPRFGAAAPSVDRLLGRVRTTGFSFELHYGAFALWSAACFLGWFLLFECGTGLGSPGKALVRLRLSGTGGGARISIGQSLLRSAVKAGVVLLGPFGLLYLLAARGRSLPHDRWSGVAVSVADRRKVVTAE